MTILQRTTVKSLLMAASAVMLMGAPAYAACQQEIQQIENRMEDANLSGSREESVQDKLDKAREAMNNNNESDCMQHVSSIRNEMNWRTAAQQGTDGQTGTQTDSQTGLRITQPQPEVNVNQAQPEIVIEQPKPDVTVKQDKPDVNVEMSQPQVQGEVNPDVQISEAGEPEVTYRRTGETTIRYQDQGTQAQGQQQQAQRNQQGQQQDQMAARTDADGEPDSMTRFQTQSRYETGDTQMDNQQAQLDATGRTGQQASVMDSMMVNELEGTTVYGRNGEELGEIDNIVRTSANSRPYAVISMGGFLGMGADRIVIPLSEIHFQGENNEATLDVSGRAELRQNPAYQAETYQDVDNNERIGDIN